MVHETIQPSPRRSLDINIVVIYKILKRINNGKVCSSVRMFHLLNDSTDCD